MDWKSLLLPLLMTFITGVIGVYARKFGEKTSAHIEEEIFDKHSVPEQIVEEEKDEEEPSIIEQVLQTGPMMQGALGIALAPSVAIAEEAKTIAPVVKKDTEELQEVITVTNGKYSKVETKEGEYVINGKPVKVNGTVERTITVTDGVKEETVKHSLEMSTKEVINTQQKALPAKVSLISGKEFEFSKQSDNGSGTVTLQTYKVNAVTSKRFRLQNRYFQSDSFFNLNSILDSISKLKEKANGVTINNIGVCLSTGVGFDVFHLLVGQNLLSLDLKQELSEQQIEQLVVLPAFFNGTCETLKMYVVYSLQSVDELTIKSNSIIERVDKNGYYYCYMSDLFGIPENLLRIDEVFESDDSKIKLLHRSIPVKNINSKSMRIITSFIKRSDMGAFDKPKYHANKKLFNSEFAIDKKFILNKFRYKVKEQFNVIKHSNKVLPVYGVIVLLHDRINDILHIYDLTISERYVDSINTEIGDTKDLLQMIKEVFIIQQKDVSNLPIEELSIFVVS